MMVRRTAGVHERHAGPGGHAQPHIQPGGCQRRRGHLQGRSEALYRGVRPHTRTMPLQLLFNALFAISGNGNSHQPSLTALVGTSSCTKLEKPHANHDWISWSTGMYPFIHSCNLGCRFPLRYIPGVRSRFPTFGHLRHLPCESVALGQDPLIRLLSFFPATA